MSAEWPWSALDLDGSADLRDVKRAYAKKLKTIDRNDPQVFQDLRDAFEVAKAQAAQHTPAKQPSMRAAAQGLDGAKPSPPPSFDDFESYEIEVPVADAPASTEPAPEPPAPDTPAFTPWGQPAQSDGIFDQNAEDRFFNQLHATFETGVWKLDPLEALLNSEIALDPDIRGRAENVLFSRLRTLVEEEERTIPQGVARLMETHFAWATDGVRFNQKYGWQSGGELVIYDVARALKGTQNLSAAIPQKEPMHGKKYRLATAVIMYISALLILREEGLSGENVVASVIMAAVPFGLIWCVTLFFWYWIDALCRMIARLPWIGATLSNGWNTALRRFAWLNEWDVNMHRPGPRSTIMFVTAGTVTTILLLTLASNT